MVKQLSLRSASKSEYERSIAQHTMVVGMIHDVNSLPWGLLHPDLCPTHLMQAYRSLSLVSLILLILCVQAGQDCTRGYSDTKCFASSIAYSSAVQRLEHFLAI